jgi:hypothetical protein
MRLPVVNRGHGVNCLPQQAIQPVVVLPNSYTIPDNRMLLSSHRGLKASFTVKSEADFRFDTGIAQMPGRTIDYYLEACYNVFIGFGL